MSEKIKKKNITDKPVYQQYMDSIPMPTESEDKMDQVDAITYIEKEKEGISEFFFENDVYIYYKLGSFYINF